MKLPTNSLRRSKGTEIWHPKKPEKEPSRSKGLNAGLALFLLRNKPGEGRENSARCGPLNTCAESE